MSAPVLPDDASPAGESSDFDSLLIAQLEAQQTQIAQELHDAVGSQLAALMMMLGATQALHAQGSTTHAALAQAIAQLELAVQATRALARGLMPVDAAPGGLWRMLERLCADYDQLHGLACDFAMQGDFDSVPQATANHLYRIAQEAITNALRHGQATHIQLSLTQHAAHYEMAISDNGKGLHKVPTVVAPVGAGLRSIQMRCRIIQAQLHLQSSALQGTTLKVVWSATDSKPNDVVSQSTT